MCRNEFILSVLVMCSVISSCSSSCPYLRVSGSANFARLIVKQVLNCCVDSIVEGKILFDGCDVDMT